MLLEEKSSKFANIDNIYFLCYYYFEITNIQLGDVF